MQAGQRQVIFVLGMHRSGTSAIMRSLRALGVEPGDDLLAPMPGVNPHGFYEHAAVVDLDQRLLAAAGTSWYRVDFAAGNGSGRWPAAGPELDEAVALVARETARHRVWGVKDPRLCILLPFWQEAVKRAGAQAFSLVAVRNPLDVALSLQARDGMHPDYALLLWLRYMQSLLQALRPGCLVLAFERLLGAPGRELQRIAACLDLPAQRELDSLAAGCLDRGLVHHSSSPADLRGYCPAPNPLPGLYETLLKVAQAGPLDAGTLAGLRHAFGAAVSTRLLLRAAGGQAEVVREQSHRLRHQEAALAACRRPLQLYGRTGRLPYCLADRLERFVCASQARHDLVMLLTAPLRFCLKRILRRDD